MGELTSTGGRSIAPKSKAFLSPDSHAEASGVRGHVRRLRAGIRAALREYLRHLAGNSTALEASIDASWANVNPACALNGPHVHPFAAISGAYYVDCGGAADSSSGGVRPP